MVCTSNSSIYTDLKLRKKKKKKFLISGEFISWFWCVVTILRFITVLIIINALIIIKKHKTKSYMKIFIHGMKKLTEYKCITEFCFGKQIKPLDVML